MVKWRPSEWAIQLQKLQPRFSAAKAPPTPGRGRPPRLRHPRPSAPPPLLPAPSRGRPVLPGRGPSRAAARARPFPAGSPLARLRSGPPSASSSPSPSFLPSPLPQRPLPQFSIPFPPALGGPRPNSVCLGPQSPRSRRCPSLPMWAPAGCPRRPPSSWFRWALPSPGVAF